MIATVRTGVGFFAAALLLASVAGVPADRALVRSLAAGALGAGGALFLVALNSRDPDADEGTGPNDGGPAGP